MTLSLHAVTRLAQSVMDFRFSEVSVNGVISGTGDPSRVELLVTVRRDEPRRLMLNLTRVDSGAFERDLRLKLAALIPEQS